MPEAEGIASRVLHRARVLRPAEAALYVALFTVSWDRIANVSIGNFNVKLAIAAFGVAALLELIDCIRTRTWPVGGAAHWSGWLLPAAVIALVISSVFAEAPVNGFLQVGTVLAGAIGPFVSVVLVTARAGVRSALTALIWGGIVAGAFGMYQLLAFYTGLPQFVEYRARDQSGLGRISSFSYEAAYFGYFIVLVIGALFARAAARGHKVELPLVAFFSVLLVLVNSRAVVFTAPLLVALLYVHWPRGTPRRRLWPALAGAAALGLGVLALVPRIREGIWANVSSIFDPNEVSSNAPRLDAVSDALRIIRDHIVIGIGPGNLIEALPDYGQRVGPGQTPNSVVVNNVWLQALLDGGLIALILQAAIVAIVIWRFWIHGRAVARLLVTGWMTIVLVGGALTSYYWDLKLWSVLGLVVVAQLMSTSSSPSRGVEGERRNLRGRRRAAQS